MTHSISSHRVEIGVGALTFVLGSILGLTSGCSSSAAASSLTEPSPVPVETTVADERAVPRTVSLTGTLVANREADVASDAGGRVVATFVERGDLVQSGAPLARLDARAAALGSVEASATAAGRRAEDENAALECARAERLFAENAISRAERDRAVTSCASASHSLSAANARAGLAQKNLSDATIRAPFAGVVVDRSVDLGEFVAPGRAVATIVELRVLRLELAVPEPVTTAVRAGGTVSFEVAAYPGREFTGVVGHVSPKLRTQSRDLLVDVEIDNASGTLRPGMFATARLVVGEERVPTLPRSAITGRVPVERVFVVKDSRVEERIVSTGSRVGDRVAVSKGLTAGELVVDHPKSEVRDGIRVK